MNTTDEINERKLSSRKVDAGLFFLIGWVTCGAFVMFLDPDTRGAIEHASGRVICTLVEQPDKTTEWECKENPEYKQ